MRPTRWLPLPTSRATLRRLTASLTLAAFTLPMAAVPVAHAADETAGLGTPRSVPTSSVPASPGAQTPNRFVPPPAVAPAAQANDGSLCSELSYVGANSDYKAENTPKFGRYKNRLEQISTAHRQASPEPVKDAILEEVRKANANQVGALDQAVKDHELYLKYMADAADKICPAIQSFGANVALVEQRVNAAKATQTSETCAFSDLQQITEGSSADVSRISTAIENMTSRMQTIYETSAKENKAAIELQQAAAMRVPGEIKHHAIDRVRALGLEFKALWGADEEIKRATEGKIRDTRAVSYFGQLLTTLDFQKSKIISTKAGLDRQNREMQGLIQNGCRSLTNANQVGQTGGTPSQTPPGTARVCNAGENAFDAGHNMLDPANCRNTSTASSGIAGSTPGTTTTPGATTPGAGNGVGGDLTTTTGDVSDPSRRPPASSPPAAVEEESFFSKYKTPLIIGGVGVAAVAGALIYKKTEDDKAKKSARYMEMEAAMAVQSQQNSSGSSSSSSSSSSDSSSSSGTSAPADEFANLPVAPIQTTLGATLLVKNSPSGSYSTNGTLPDITIKILSANGMATGDSATDITVGCGAVTPAPCTLTGTLTVNTNLGEAVFKGLKFTGAHTNVTLQFSAPGFAPVQSGNFSVSARQ